VLREKRVFCQIHSLNYLWNPLRPPPSLPGIYQICRVDIPSGSAWLPILGEEWSLVGALRGCTARLCSHVSRPSLMLFIYPHYLTSCNYQRPLLI